MKKNLLLLYILLSATTIVFAQQNQLLWQANQISANAQANQVIAFAVDDIGNSFTINNTQDASSLFISNRLISYDANGVKKWDIQTDSCFTTCNEKYTCILPIGNGDVIFVGYKETTANVWQIILKKYRSNGTLAWQRYNNGDAAKPIKAVFNSTQNVVVALDIDGITTGKDFGVATYSKANGTEIWKTIIPDAAVNNDIFDDEITDITLDAQDNIFAVGLTNSTTAGVHRMLISKWDVSGLIGYSNVIEPNVNVSNAKPKIIADNANHLYVASNLYGTTLLKKFTDTTTDLLFTKVIKKDSTFTEFVDVQIINHKIYVLNNSHYIVPDNSFQGYYITNNIYFIHASDSAGNTIWEKKFLEKFDQGTNKNNFGSATTLAKCTNNLVVSSLQEKSNANPFFVISKIDLSGNLMWYDSSKADIGKKLIAAVDANCNPYLNYEAYAGSPTLHSIIKKYSDVAQAPSSVFNYITNPTSVVYVANKIEIIIDAETIQRCFLVEALGKKIDVSNLSNNKITIYKNELANGVYIAVIQTNKATYCQKIVVQY